MKIYTNTIDLTNPAPKQFWVAPYSDFGIGIKFVNGKNAVEGEISLTDNKGNTLTAAENKYGDGFTVFNVTSGEKDSDVIYTVIAPNGQKVLITQNVTNSTVFETGSSGGGELPSEVEFTKITVGSSIINEGDIECDDLETQIINSIVGDFTNLKTEELSASTINASDTITAPTISTETLDADNINVHYKVTTEEASTGYLNVWNDATIGNMVEASMFNGSQFAPKYSDTTGIMNSAPYIAYESFWDGDITKMHGHMANDWKVDNLTSDFFIDAYTVNINNELRFADNETGDSIVITVNDIKQLLQLINTGA